MGKPNVPLISNVLYSPVIFIYLSNKEMYLTNKNNVFAFRFLKYMLAALGFYEMQMFSQVQ